MTPRVWVAEPDDAETVATLMVEFRDHNGLEWPSANSFLASVERLVERPDADLLLGAPHDDAAPAGVCQLRYRHSIWMAADDCWLEDLYVRPAARRHGLGAALVQAALARARARGCRRVELDTNEANHAALALYHRAGFSERSKRPEGEARQLFLGVRLDGGGPD